MANQHRIVGLDPSGLFQLQNAAARVDNAHTLVEHVRQSGEPAGEAEARRNAAILELKLKVEAFALTDAEVPTKRAEMFAENYELDRGRKKAAKAVAQLMEDAHDGISLGSLQQAVDDMETAVKTQLCMGRQPVDLRNPTIWRPSLDGEEIAETNWRSQMPETDQMKKPAPWIPNAHQSLDTSNPDAEDEAVDMTDAVDNSRPQAFRLLRVNYTEVTEGGAYVPTGSELSTVGRYISSDAEERVKWDFDENGAGEEVDEDVGEEVDEGVDVE